MNIFYVVTFGVLALCTAVLELCKQRGPNKDFSSNRTFTAFRDNYLFVYSLMMAGDWLQGPYVFALYEYYGFDVGDIGRLFIAGFGSSMVFGTLAGSLADKHGRKLAALLYVVTYALSCATKHWNSYSVLMVGRLLGGVATSLLFSVFESWIVSEHFKRGYDEDWLGDVFSRAVLLGNGLVAILAGLLANFLVEGLNLGPVAPFDAAALFLLIGGGVIIVTWPENFGEGDHSGGVLHQLREAFKTIRANERIFLLGAMQALFEGSMYTFIFLWTPALSPNKERIPHGFIFAMFMMSSMAGSAVAGHLFAHDHRPERYMKHVFLLASACMLVPVLFHVLQTRVTDALDGKSADAGAAAAVDAAAAAGGTGEATGEATAAARRLLEEPLEISAVGMLTCIAFCVYEVCVGLFWPSMMRMRTHYLPDSMRATLINCFRIPLNLFVCVVLYNVSKFPLAVMFGLCSAFLLVAYACSKRMEALTRSCMVELEKSGSGDTDAVDTRAIA